MENLTSTAALALVSFVSGVTLFINWAGNSALLRHFSLIATDRRRNEEVLARTSFKEFRTLLSGVDQKGCEVVIRKVNKISASENVFV
jgi:hypothetical protein